MGCLHFLSTDEATAPYLLSSGAVDAALAALSPASGPQHPLVAEHATGLLMNVAQCRDVQRPLVDRGCLAVLLRQLPSPTGTGTARYCATVAVNYLCYDNPQGKRRVVEAGGVPLVLETLRAAQCAPRHAEALCATLQSLTVEDAHGPVVLEHGGLAALLGLLDGPTATPRAREYALGLLQNLSAAPAALEAVLRQDGVGRMVRVLGDPEATPAARAAALGVLLSVSLDEGVCDALNSREVALALVEVMQGCLASGAGASELLDDAVATVQNVAIAEAGRLALVACEAVPGLAAVVADQAVLAPAKECAACALMHICLDNPANRRRVVKTGVTPALRRFGDVRVQERALRDQILRFCDELDAAARPQAPVSRLDLTALKLGLDSLSCVDAAARPQAPVSRLDLTALKLGLDSLSCVSARKSSRSSRKQEPVACGPGARDVRVVSASQAQRLDVLQCGTSKGGGHGREQGGEGTRSGGGEV